MCTTMCYSYILLYGIMFIETLFHDMFALNLFTRCFLFLVLQDERSTPLHRMSVRSVRNLLYTSLSFEVNILLTECTFRTLHTLPISPPPYSAHWEGYGCTHSLTSPYSA